MHADNIQENVANNELTFIFSYSNTDWETE